jgi:hypothetical protein
MGLGDFLHYLIKIFTFAQGEKIANLIAKKIFKKEDCGCNKRRNYLNNLFKKEEDKTFYL